MFIEGWRGAAQELACNSTARQQLSLSVAEFARIRCTEFWRIQLREGQRQALDLVFHAGVGRRPRQAQGGVERRIGRGLRQTHHRRLRLGLRQAHRGLQGRCGWLHGNRRRVGVAASKSQAGAAGGSTVTGGCHAAGTGGAAGACTGTTTSTAGSRVVAPSREYHSCSMKPVEGLAPCCCDGGMGCAGGSCARVDGGGDGVGAGSAGGNPAAGRGRTSSMNGFAGTGTGTFSGCRRRDHCNSGARPADESGGRPFCTGGASASAGGGVTAGICDCGGASGSPCMTGAGGDSLTVGGILGRAGAAAIRPESRGRSDRDSAGQAGHPDPHPSPLPRGEGVAASCCWRRAVRCCWRRAARCPLQRVPAASAAVVAAARAVAGARVAGPA